MAVEETAVAPPPSQGDVSAPPPAPAEKTSAAAGDSGDTAKGGKGKKGKDKGKGKGGKRKGAKNAGDSAPAQGQSGRPDLSLAGHPLAARRVAEAKSWGAVIGFFVGGYLSLPTHTVADAAFRALMAGAFSYVIVWGAAVFVWRRLVLAELRHAEHELLTRELARRGIAPSSAPPNGGARSSGGGVRPPT